MILRMGFASEASMTSKVKLQKVIIYGGSRAFATRQPTRNPCRAQTGRSIPAAVHTKPKV
jgi:hypothetical protein